MTRVLAAAVVVMVVLAAGQAQTRRKPRARFVAVEGRCGPSYVLKDAPPYFKGPRTRAQVLHVLRILRAAPPGAEVECHNFDGTWAPYAFASRRVRTAEMLMMLGRRREALEELWGIYLRGAGVVYEGRKLPYKYAKDLAVPLIIDSLWDPADIERRLKDPRYEGLDRIRMRYEQRKNAVPPG